MNNTNEQLIYDFVHGTGSFADMDNWVDPQDLSRAKFYQSAAKELYARAKAEKSHPEKKRLMAIVESHLVKVDHILAKYGV